MSKKNPTIYDVAREAGVTAATVSNTLSARVPVAPETRRRVEAAIARLGYRPNLVARGLARRRTALLALVVPNITNPFYAEMALLLERLAIEREHHLVVCNTLNDPAEGRAQLDHLSRRWVDAVVVMPGGVAAEDVDAVIRRGMVAMACIWGEEPVRPVCSGVDVDFALGGALAARHFLAWGHRDVGVIVESRSNGDVAHVERLGGFARELATVELTIPRIQRADGTLAGGYAAGRTLLEAADRPSAIFATNDLMALGVMEAAADLGISVPHQLSVVGFDDILLASHIRPPLTTVAMPKDVLATRVAELLFSLLALESGAPVSNLPVAPRLIQRESVAPPSAVYSPAERRPEPSV